MLPFILKAAVAAAIVLAFGIWHVRAAVVAMALVVLFSIGLIIDGGGGFLPRMPWYDFSYAGGIVGALVAFTLSLRIHAQRRS